MSRLTGMTWVTRALSILNLSEMTGQLIPIMMRILVLIKTNNPGKSNAKHCTQRKWFFSKTSRKIPIIFKKCLVQPWSSRPVLTFESALR